MKHWAIRAALDRALANAPAGVRAWRTAPLTDEEWAKVKEEKFPDLIQTGAPDGVQRALEWIWTHLRPASKQRKRRSHQPSVSKALRRHEQAVSDLLAAHAELEDARAGFGIAEFRQEVLKDRLCRLEDIHSWIQERAEEEQPETDGDTHALTMLTYRRYVSFKKPKWVDRKVIGVDSLEAESRPRYVQTHPGGTLDRLRRISEKLSKSYLWDPTESVCFVLTRQTPQVRAIERFIRPSMRLPACSRILLEIDPTCTPEEVAHAYAHARKQEFGRLRRLSEKHARLAVFAATHPPGSPFQSHPEASAQRLETWNGKCREWGKPKWRYRQASIFARDCRQARDRLFDVGNWGKDPGIPMALRDSLYTGRGAFEAAGISLPK